MYKDLFCSVCWLNSNLQIDCELKRLCCENESEIDGEIGESRRQLKVQI